MWPVVWQPRLPPCKASLLNHVCWLHCTTLCGISQKKRNSMEGLWLNLPVYAWPWISSSIFSESRDGFAAFWSKFWSVFATLHWLLLIPPTNFCTSQRKKEFCEGISQIPPTHWKQSCSPYPLGISLKIILVIPCRYFISKAFLMAHVRAREFSGGRVQSEEHFILAHICAKRD